MKIAHIAPLRRMPRSIDFLTYRVPDTRAVEVGDLVSIPLRSAHLRGVVLSVDELEEKRNLKDITAVLKKGFIEKKRLRLYQQLSAELAQSVSTVLSIVFPKKISLPSFPKNLEEIIISRAELPQLKKIVDFVMQKKTVFIEVLDFIQAVAVVHALKKHFTKKLWIVVPHHHDRSFISEAMTRSQVLSAQETPEAVIVLRSGSEEHASYDRNPRYDIRSYLKKFCKSFDIPLVFIDVSPRIEDLVFFKEKLLVESSDRTVPHFIDLKYAWHQGLNSLLSDELLKAMSESLQSGKSVLFSYNRKKESSWKTCLECGNQAEQKEACERCGGVRFRRGAVTTLQIEKHLRTLFPAISIFRIEKGWDQVLPNTPCIILATRYFQDSVFLPKWSNRFGLIAELQADMGLQAGTYDAVEKILIRLYELWGMATRSRADFYVQTWDIDLMRKLFFSRDQVLEEELKMRRALHYPPFGVLVRKDGEEQCYSLLEFEQKKIEWKNLKDDIIIRVWH